MASNEQAIYQFFVSKSVGKAPTAGAMGNIQVESGFSPTAFNSREQAIGIVQWEGGRRTNLQNFAANRGTTETDLATQLDFMWHELTTSYAVAYTAWVSSTDPTNAAQIWQAHYEVSSTETLGERESNARNIFQSISSGSVPSGGGTASPPGAVLVSAPKYTYPLTSAERTMMVSTIVSGGAKSSPVFTLADLASWLGAPTTISSQSQLVTWLNTQNDSAKDQTLAVLYANVTGSIKAGTIDNGGIWGFLNTVGNSAGSIINEVLTPVQILEKAWSDITSAKFWERVGLYALGGLVVLVVAVEFFRTSDTPSIPEVTPNV